MPCYSPWFRESSVNKRPLSCGRCIGCRLERSRQWAVRCMHEAQLWDKNCFVTLTYDKDHLPVGGGLVYEHFRLFVRRLRKAARKSDVRFYMCGEYGEARRRPHYHACLFNWDFDDKVPAGKSGSGFDQFRSPLLERLWTFGRARVSAMNFETAAYTARYVCAIEDGKGLEKVYEAVDLETGEVHEVPREFARMSLRPGIGARWYEKFWSDVYPEGEVVVNGHKARAPAYYDRRYRLQNLPGYFSMLEKRHLQSVEGIPETMPDRLGARQVVTEARLGLSKRSI
ncbi:replication associated protein [Microviridae sp.]|nr:replication associated protein [Microviridae sp.]